MYSDFMDAAYQVADRVELITPGRFLFNAGQTPKAWNRKMLEDAHLKVLAYEADASAVFPETDIKGGVAVTLRDVNRNLGPIGVFTAHSELNGLVKKILSIETGPYLDSIIASQGLFKFSDEFFIKHADYSNVQDLAASGTRDKITSSFIENTPNLFSEDPFPTEHGQVKILARISGSRAYRFAPRNYIKSNEHLNAFKLFIPEGNGSGKFGETLSTSIIGYPGECSTDTFLSAGPFSTEEEPKNLATYYKTKFFRALLGVRKATQHSPSLVWQTIPLQDFTPCSDIDWTQSVADIDKQLYAKYGLSNDEIEFIETHVKEMS